MKTRRLAKAEHDIGTSLLGHGAHTEIGRLLPPDDAAHDTITEAVEQRGEQLWYAPAGNDVEIRGLLLKLNETDQNTLGGVLPSAAGAVEWIALNEDSETESALHVLTEDEYRQIRGDVPSTVIADIVAADDRERTGRPRDGESVENAAKRLAALMRK